jgi:hypothetical protein
VTADGRVLTGLVAEDSPQRVVLKSQGGKLETIAREDVEAMKVSPLSLMPEDLEKQLKPQELADLFALLTLDKPPGDPTARRLPGSGKIVPRETLDAGQAAELIGEVAPGFSARKIGKPGLAIVAEHAGREGVLRTWAVSANEPCVMSRMTEVPKDKQTRLVLSVSHDPDQAWQLTVRAEGKQLHASRIGDAKDWQTIALDLTPLAGRKVKLELIQARSDDQPSAAYWHQVEVISQ